MKIDFKKIINIKNKQDLKDFLVDKPIFESNYLFHYLVIIGNLQGLKLQRVPIYLENTDGLNGFHLAAKESHIDILYYLIDTYPEYIYNRNARRDTFIGYLQFEEFNNLIKKYPNLDWDELLLRGTPTENHVLKSILVNLNFKQITEFIKLYKIKPTNKNQYLTQIIKNTNLNSAEKIILLDLFSDQEINEKDEFGGGLLLNAIDYDDIILVNYLIKRNIDINYNTFIHTDSPLIFSLSLDILNNQFKYSKIIIDKLSKINQYFCKTNNRYLDNPLHTIFYIRINRNNQISSANKMKNINYSPDFEILKNSLSENWNQFNIEKLTPFHLIMNLDFEVYSKFFTKSNIQISKLILEDIKKNSDLNKSSNKWLKIFEKLDEYKEPENKIELSNDEYSHYTMFQAKFKDVGIFTIYLSNTYSDLLIPNLTSYQIGNITFDDTFPFSDNIVEKEPVFPWVISYYNENEYYIHPYLNNIINSTRRSDKKRFAAVFVSLIYDKMLHANIMVYDFKNMTVERFEPYGNTMGIDGGIDDVLEEELTWNTGLRYIRPNDYLPVAGFQTVSDETNIINNKAGDFGGFCLAWCLWYLETRLKNPDVISKVLVDKVINKISKLDLKFSEYIRNYSNKINSKRVEYLELIGIDPKKISNSHLTVDINLKLANYLVNKFSSFESKELE